MKRIDIYVFGIKPSGGQFTESHKRLFKTIQEEFNTFLALEFLEEGNGEPVYEVNFYLVHSEALSSSVTFVCCEEISRKKGLDFLFLEGVQEIFRKYREALVPQGVEIRYMSGPGMKILFDFIEKSRKLKID